MDKIFFNNWETLIRILVIGVLAYLSLVLLLRISGKRTLSKMNAFDFIVTIALGSTLASSITSKDVALIDAILAFAVLVFLQYAITALSVRSKSVRKLVKSDPVLLFYNGRFLYDVMKKERVTQTEIEAALRENGYGSSSNIDAIILETQGEITVIKNFQEAGDSSLSKVKKMNIKEQSVYAG